MSSCDSSSSSADISSFRFCVSGEVWSLNHWVQLLTNSTWWILAWIADSFLRKLDSLSYRITGVLEPLAILHPLLVPHLNPSLPPSFPHSLTHQFSPTLPHSPTPSLPPSPCPWLPLSAAPLSFCPGCTVESPDPSVSSAPLWCRRGGERKSGKKRRTAKKQYTVEPPIKDTEKRTQ